MIDSMTSQQAAQLGGLLTPDLMGDLHQACQVRCFGTFEPDELYALTLYRVARSFDTFKGGNFRGWVFTIMFSVWKSELQRRGRREEDLTLPDSVLEGWDPQVADPYCLEEHVLSGYSPEIEAALQALNPKQRAGLLLHAEGYTHTEIVAMLGLGAVGTSCSMIRRAKQKMIHALTGAA